MSKPSPIDALCERWRKIIQDCPPKHRQEWQHVFEATETHIQELSRVAPLVDGVVGALRRIQWGACDGRAAVCPECSQAEKHGHQESCSIGAALKAYEEGA